MGADVYLISQYEPQALEIAQWQAARIAWAVGLGGDGDVDQHDIEERANRCYFRDAYNSASILARVGLSWADDILPLLDDQQRLPMDAAKWLRECVATSRLDQHRQQLGAAMLSQFQLSEPEMGLPPDYFERKRDHLLALLDASIESGEPLYCSL